MKVIYLHPDISEYPDLTNTLNFVSEFERLSDAEKLNVAKEYPNEDIEIFTLEEFQAVFNNELISDLGYIYFINE